MFTQYTSMDEAVQLITRLGVGTWMAKIDMKDHCTGLPTRLLMHALEGHRIRGYSPPVWAALCYKDILRGGRRPHLDRAS